MKNERWERLAERFETALSLPAEQRTVFLERVAASEPELRAELASLLEANTASGQFLEQPPELAPGDVTTDEALLPAGTQLGAWRVRRFIGRGGMGEVYEVERADGQFEQHAALKVTRREAAKLLDRFNAERQILARLDHPGIARLLDGGMTPDSRPFAVMEYVEGQTITNYCNARRAGLQERLALFLQVCVAVQHAHGHLIVHRDIKPANVLIDAEGRARLLDFGIAKPLDSAPVAPGSGEMTMMLLTPDYAAPEQLTGEAVTIATDVYALGILLFELLVGCRPRSLEGQPLARVLANILEESVPQASAVAARTPDARVLPRLLQGDLDAIIAKCVRRETQQRYTSVNALKLDIERSLIGEPVLARGDARWYVFGRMIRRYRWAAASVGALIVILSIGIAATSWQAQRARREAARATATRDFLISIYKASDPRIAQDKPRGQITAREMLDASVDRIDREFAGDRETQIELLGVATEIYRELDERERYADLQRRYLALARKHYGNEHPVVIGALLDEASFVREQFDYPRAQRMLDDIQPLIRRAGLERSVLAARWWLVRGQALFGDTSNVDQQLAALRHAVDLFTHSAPRDPGRVTALADIGATYSNTMNYAAARSYFEQAIAASETVDNRNDGELATINSNLGLIAFNQGDFEAADVAYGRAEEIIRRTYGSSRNIHWIPAANRARAAHLGGNRERASNLFADLLRNIPQDSRHHDAFEAREWYAGCLAAEGRPLEAVPILEGVEKFYLSQSAYDYEVPRVRLTLGDAYARAGRSEDARRTLAAALEKRVASVPPDFQPILAIRERWGRFLLSQGELVGAAEQFQEVIRQAQARKLSHIALAHGGAARVALARGDLAAARAASATALDLYEHVTGFRDVRMGPYLWLVHSEVLLQSGDKPGARAWAKKALDARRLYDHPSAASIVDAETALRAAD